METSLMAIRIHYRSWLSYVIRVHRDNGPGEEFRGRTCPALCAVVRVGTTAKSSATTLIAAERSSGPQPNPTLHTGPYPLNQRPRSWPHDRRHGHRSPRPPPGWPHAPAPRTLVHHRAQVVCRECGEPAPMALPLSSDRRHRVQAGALVARCPGRCPLGSMRLQVRCIQAPAPLPAPTLDMENRYWCVSGQA
jgi:hypothetical protein